MKLAEQDQTYECWGTNQTHILELIIIYCTWNKLCGNEWDGERTTGKDQEEEDSSEPTLVPASGSFKSGWASWGCNVPLITQALGNYATGFTLASQSHRRACGFTHGHLKASAHSCFLEVDFFFPLSYFYSILKLPVLWSDVLLCSLLISAAWQKTTDHTHTNTHTYTVYMGTRLQKYTQDMPTKSCIYKETQHLGFSFYWKKNYYNTITTYYISNYILM